MRKILIMGLLFGAVASWSTGCSGGDDDDDDDDDVTGITIAGGTSVAVGSSINLTATASPGDEDVTTSATWTTNSAGVATVGANTGVVTGVSAGSATITATLGDVSDTHIVTVTTSGAAATLTFTGSSWPHNGDNAFVRILEGTTVVDCRESAPIAGNAFSIDFGAILDPGTLYTYETFADLNDDNNYEMDGSDHRWTGTFTANAGANVVNVPHGNTQAALTWANNAGCPGT